MKKETISRIITCILHQEIIFDVEYFPFEETKGHYKNIYKIVSHFKTYVLKKAKEKELDIYQSVNNASVNLPYFYGSYHYYGNDYILMEYVLGTNLLKMEKENLIKAINGIIDIQKKYWNSSLIFGQSKDDALKQRHTRLSYLPSELKETYARYIDCFNRVPVTFSHEDLLPFNVILNKDRVCFIDLEVGGILPYPTMLARLIAHSEDSKDALFYLSRDNYDFAIDYYYENLIKQQGIKKEEYLRTMNLFIYNELIEWIYVYKKNNFKTNDFYNRYYQKAIVKRNDLSE